jgi:hypothetical protein
VGSPSCVVVCCVLCVHVGLCYVVLCGVVLCCVNLCCVDCRVGYPKLGNIIPPQHLGGKDHPRCQAHVIPHLNVTRIHMCLERGEKIINAINYGGEVGLFE